MKENMKYEIKTDHVNKSLSIIVIKIKYHFEKWIYLFQF